MPDKVLVKPLSGTEKPFYVDAADAGQYAGMKDANGFNLYQVAPVDAVVLDTEGKPMRVPDLDPKAMARLEQAGQFVSTGDEARDLARRVDQERGELTALNQAGSKVAAFGRIPGISQVFEGDDPETDRLRQRLKSEHAGYGVAGDVFRVLSTFGALGAYGAGAQLTSMAAAHGGPLAGALTGVGLGAIGGATENSILEAMHAIDNDQELAAENLLSAAGTGALFGGLAGGVIPAAGALARGAKVVGREALKRGPTGAVARKVFKHLDDRAVTASKQREAFEKTLEAERKEIGGFTPEGFKRKGAADRIAYSERLKELGGVHNATVREMAEAADNLRAARSAQKSVVNEWTSSPVKMRDRVGSPEWRKTFERQVQDVDGTVHTKWGWSDDHWEIVEEELTARIGAMADAGYGTESKFLQELMTPKHKRAPGVMMGRLSQAYMQAGTELLAGKAEAAAAKDILRGLLGDADVWGRKAAGINQEVVEAMDDALDAVGQIKAAQLPDKFDLMPQSTRMQYENAPVMYKQLDDALGTLKESAIFGDGAIRTLRKNLTKHLDTANKAKRSALVAEDMEKARSLAAKLNMDQLGRSSAPAVGAETAIAAVRTVGQALDQLDTAAGYVGKAINNQKFINKFEKGRVGIYAVRALNDEERNDLYRDIEAMVEEYSNRPEAMVNRIGQNVERMGMTDMGIANHMAGQMVSHMEYLSRKLPATPEGAYGTTLPPADSEVDSFLETAAALQSWSAVVASVADGTVSIEATEAMQELAPALYERSRADIAAVIEPLDVFDAPDSVLSGLNIFMGDLDPVYSPEFILRLQDTSAQTSAMAELRGQQQQFVHPQNPQALTSVPQHQNPQTGITPGERMGSY